MKKYQALIKKLAQRQRHRHPTQLWIVVDERSSTLTSHLNGINVIHLSDKSFEYAYETLQKYNVLGKGSLIIFMCGIYSIVNSVSTVCARAKNCSNSLVRHSLKAGVTSSVLIYRALALHKNILDTTVNDQVIFCELIPLYLLKVYKCSSYHTHANDVLVEDYKHYIKIIEEYNYFVKEHSRICEFDKWNLIINSYPIKDNVSNSLCVTYNYDQIDCKRASEFISKSAKELLEVLKTRSKKVVAPPQLQKNQTADTNKLQRCSSTLKRKEPSSRLTEIPHEVIQEKKQGTETFEEVVIITLPECAEYDFFKNDKVHVIASQTFDFDDILSLLEAQVESHPRKTLYLLVSSILWNASYQNYKPCTECFPGLSVLVPNHKHQYTDILYKGKESLHSLSIKVDLFLKHGSAFCVLPPPPPILLNVSNIQDHLMFHEVQIDEKVEFYFSTRHAIKYFKSHFTSFSKLLISSTIYTLKECGISTRAFDNYRNSTMDWKYHINCISYESLKHNKSVLDDGFRLWLNAITVLIQDCIPLENNVDLRDVLSANKKSAKRQRTESNSSDNAAIQSEPILNSRVPGPGVVQNAPYDHVVFVGCCDKQLSLLPVDEYSRRISLITLKPSYKWVDLNDKLKTIKSLTSCESILFIIIGSVKLIASEYTLSGCSKCKCPSPVNCLTLIPGNKKNFVVRKLRNINRLIFCVDKQFMNRSEVALILLPTMCAKVKNIINHENLHEFMDKMNNPYLILGNPPIWNSVSKKVEICWNEKMYSRMGKSSEKFKGIVPHILALSEATSAVHWIDGQEVSLTKEIQKCKTLLRNLIAAANSSIQLTNEWQKDSNKTLQKSDINRITLIPHAEELSFRDQRNSEFSLNNIRHYDEKPNLEMTSQADEKFDIKNAIEKALHSDRKPDIKISVKNPPTHDKEPDIKLCKENTLNFDKKPDVEMSEVKIPYHKENNVGLSVEKLLHSDKITDLRISDTKPPHVDNRHDVETSITRTYHSDEKLDSEISVKKFKSDRVISVENALICNKKSYEKVSGQKMLHSDKKSDIFISQEKIPNFDKLTKDVAISKPPTHYSKKSNNDVAISKPDKKPDEYGAISRPLSYFDKKLDENVAISKPPPHSYKKLDEDVAISKLQSHFDKIAGEDMIISKPPLHSKKLAEDAPISKPPPHVDKILDNDVSISKQPPHSVKKPDDVDKKLNKDVSITKQPPHSDKKPDEVVAIPKPLPHTLADQNINEDMATTKPPLHSDKKLNEDMTLSKQPPHSDMSDEYVATSEQPQFNNVCQDITDYKLDTSDVDIINHKIPFKYAYILSKRDLSSVLDTGSFENVEHVLFNPLSISEKEVPVLIKKFGSISYDSVCFLALDIFCLTNEIESLVCKKLECKTPICIKKGDGVTEESIHSYLSNKIVEVTSFISKLSIYLPVVVLPFVPVGAFCDENSSTEHKRTHMIHETNSYVVSGEKKYWENFKDVSSKLWCDVMKSNNEKYFVAKEFQNYISKHFKHLVFMNDVKYFDFMCSEISVWKKILESFLKILLHSSDKKKQSDVNKLEEGNALYPAVLHEKKLTQDKVPNSSVENSPKSTTCREVFDRAIIITIQEFTIHMEKLKSSNVEIVYIEPGNVDEAIVAMKDHQKSETNKILYLTHTEILGLSRTKLGTLCSSCSKPLEVVSPSEYWSGSLEVFRSIDSLTKRANTFLNSSSSLVILPLLPLTVLVVDETRHQSYHTFGGEDKRHNLTTAKSVRQFRVLYSKLQDHFEKFTVLSKFNGASQLMKSYRQINTWNFFLDVVTDENVLQRSGKFKMHNNWQTCFSEFLFDNIKPESEINENDTSSDIKPVISNCTTVSSPNIQSVDSKNSYFNHTVFVCFCEEHCELLYVIEENYKNTSVVLVKNSLEWTEAKRKIDSVLEKPFKKMLFIVIGCINLMGINVPEPLCIQGNCKNSISYLSVRKMNKETLCTFRIIALRSFLSDLRMSFKKSSVVLGPLFPMKCFPKFVSSDMHHGSIHETLENQIHPIADKQKWSSVSEEFETHWCDEMLGQLNKDMCAEKVFQLSNIIEHFQSLRIPAINWVEPKNILTRVNYIEEMKLFFKNFMNIACASINSNSKNIACLVPSSSGKKFRRKCKPNSRQYTNLFTETGHISEIKVEPEELESTRTDEISGCKNETVFGNAAYEEYTAVYAQTTVCNRYKGDNSNQALDEYSSINSQGTNGLLSASEYPAVSYYPENTYPTFFNQMLNGHSVPNNQTSNNYCNNYIAASPNVTGQMTNMYPTDASDMSSGYPTDASHMSSGYPTDTSHMSSGYPTDASHMSSIYPATYQQQMISYPGVNQVVSEYPADGNQMNGGGHPGNLKASEYPLVYENQQTSEHPSHAAWIASWYAAGGNYSANGYLTVGSQVGSEYAADGNQITSGHPTVGTQETSGYPTFSTVTSSEYPAFSNVATSGYPAVNEVGGNSAVGNQISGGYQAVVGERVNECPTIDNHVISSQENVNQIVSAATVNTWLNNGQYSLTSNEITGEYTAYSNQVASGSVGNEIASTNLATSAPILNHVAASGYLEICQMNGGYPVASNKIDGVSSANDQVVSQYEAVCNQMGNATNSRAASRNKELKSQSDISINLNIVKKEKEIICHSKYTKSSKEQQCQEKFIKQESYNGVSSGREVTNSPFIKKRSHSRSPRRYSSRSENRVTSRRLRSRSRDTSNNSSPYSKRLRPSTPSQVHKVSDSKYLSNSRSNFVKKENETSAKLQDSQRIYKEDKMENIKFSQNAVPKSIENFSVDVALDLLEGVSNKVGILGEAAKGLVKSVKLELKIDEKRAFNIINEENNALLIQIVVDKLEDSLRTATGPEKPVISKAIEWVSYLVEYVKNNSRNVKLNLKAIAKAAVNKTSKGTMDLIRTAFEYELGCKPTEKEINEVFLQVCALQFDMAD